MAALTVCTWLVVCLFLDFFRGMSHCLGELLSTGRRCLGIYSWSASIQPYPILLDVRSFIDRRAVPA